MTKLRVTFKKCEGLRYAGHLDILRTFTRILRRCEFPLKFSEGFNPHPVMTFMLPTGVGVTSDCEVADIGITSAPDINEFIENFNSHTAPGSLEITDAFLTDLPMPEIVRAQYDVKIINNGQFDAEKLNEAAKRSEIPVEKKTKKGVKEVNIKDYIFEFKAINLSEDTINVSMIISAGNTFNLKPSLVISGIAPYSGSDPLAVLPHRLKYFFADV